MPKEVTIDQKNEAIADFMGYYKNGGHFYAKDGDRGRWFKYATYDSSYDSLMHVWVKFRDLRFDNIRHQFDHSDWKTAIDNAICYQTIGNAHSLLYKAIIWYNETKQPHE